MSTNKPEVPAKPDKLKELFKLQDLLNKKCDLDFTTSPLTFDDATRAADGHKEEEEKVRHRIQWTLNYTRALTQEVAELIDSVPWKWWAKYQGFNMQNARVEVVDLFHFVISLAQVLGMDADEVHRLYVLKNQKNLERQDSGYRIKDAADCEGIR